MLLHFDYYLRIKKAIASKYAKYLRKNVERVVYYFEKISQIS